MPANRPESIHRETCVADTPSRAATCPVVNHSRAGGSGSFPRGGRLLRARIVGISFAVQPGEAAYVPLRHDYPGAPDQ